VGPNVKRLQREVTACLVDSRAMWECHVATGRYWFGDSGGGMFLVSGNEGALAGVISRGNRDGDKMTNMYCVPHRMVLAFTKKHAAKKEWRCGNGFCTPPQKPGAWLKPNVPLEVPPPADDGTPPAPAPAPQLGKIPDYDGHGRPPEGYRTPHERSEHIILDEKLIEQLRAADKTQIDEILKRLSELEKAPPAPEVPQPGPPGLTMQQVQAAIADALAKLPKPKDGTNGKDGASADPAALADVQAKLALLMQGVTVQVLDNTGAVVDQDTYPPGKPIKLQNAQRPITITQKAKSNGG
jgi:hypothetical protein